MLRHMHMHMHMHMQSPSARTSSASTFPPTLRGQQPAGQPIFSTSAPWFLRSAAMSSLLAMSANSFSIFSE